jgi:hypothetical protein
MKKLLIALLGLVLLGGLLGCGNEKDKGKNRDLDKPQSSEKEG